MEPKQKILIVDDSEINRAMLKEILGEGYEYLEAENGLRAIEILRRRTDIALVLLDLMMPEMDGFSVMDALQSHPDTADIPIIVVTAKELTPAEKERLKGHIQTLMQKGDFMSDDLLEEVKALLG